MKKTAPKSTPPDAKEWQDFLGRVVIRGATNAYLIVMLGDEELTPEEFASLALSKEDLAEMSAPLASFATKNSFTRKHGRSIIAAGDSWEAILSMFLWGRKVNRVARRHRKTAPQQTSRVVQGTVIGQNGDQFNEPAGSNAQQEPGSGPDLGPGFQVYNPGTG